MNGSIYQHLDRQSAEKLKKYRSNVQEINSLKKTSKESNRDCLEKCKRPGNFDGSGNDYNFDKNLCVLSCNSNYDINNEEAAKIPNTIQNRIKFLKKDNNKYLKYGEFLVTKNNE